MKNITKNWLKNHYACVDGCTWFLQQKDKSVLGVINNLIKGNQLEWANWTITRVFNRKQRIKYAVFAAKQVLPLFEKEYPNDKRPRQAIKAAIKCIDNNTKKNRHAARAAGAAARAAWAAAEAAEAAAEAAWAAVGDAMKTKILKYGIKLLKMDNQK